MVKFKELSEKIKQQIIANIWQVGDKLPSLREQVTGSGMSLMTVMHAYQILEEQGWILSRPQSGYYVAPKTEFLSAPAAARMTLIGMVDVNAYIFALIRATGDPAVVPFGSAFPDPGLAPLRQLSRSLTAVAREITSDQLSEHLPPGNFALRGAIAKRYAMQGIHIPPEEIVITAGALESLNLSLQAVTQPGDWVLIENPCFYGALQAIERLRLKAISITSDPQFGIDLAALEQALASKPVKACWLMTNSHNPLGFTLADEKKRQLVALLEKYDVALIEDDVYSELYFGSVKPKPALAYGRGARILHCCSFSKSLVAGFRVGWVAAGQYAEQIEKLQLMSTISTSVPMQLTLAKYLSTQRYDSHLKQLRRTLEQRKIAAWQCLKRYLPAPVRIHYAGSGYFLWIELPKRVDAGQLSQIMLENKVSIAPGKMFSTDNEYNHFFRVNTSYEWGEREEAAVITLAAAIAGLMDKASARCSCGEPRA